MELTQNDLHTDDAKNLTSCQFLDDAKNSIMSKILV